VSSARGEEKELLVVVFVLGGVVGEELGEEPPLLSFQVLAESWISLMLPMPRARRSGLEVESSKRRRETDEACRSSGLS
jgi:hypothetical protein